jgi:CheY-like chemotaxis protein
MKPIAPTGARPPARDLGRRDLVLYVEDEQSNRQVAQMRLGRDYELLLASTDREACDLVRARGSELYAVLMDIELKNSRLNGIELTKLLRGRLSLDQVPDFGRDLPPLPLVPILFVSAYGGRYREEELLSVGGNKLISKPVNFVELNNAMTLCHLNRLRRPR